MSSSLEPIVEKLRSEHKRIQGQYDVAQRTLIDLEHELQKVDTAIHALLGDRKVRVPDRPRKQRRRVKGMTGPEVTTLLERTLREDGPLNEVKLLKALQERARIAGHSRAGLHLVYKKMLRQGPFEFNGAQWCLQNGAST